MMEAVISSKTSVSIYQSTQRNIPEDSLIHTRCRENLKSHHDCVLVTRLIYEQQSTWAACIILLYVPTLLLHEK
jgi:hypothetical protein